MEQRQLRLGDILDDYCPRERRITNHAIVAMLNDEIKQTRCTTCDAEHAYKGAQVPPRRTKKNAPAALFKQVLANATPEAVQAAPVPVPAPAPILRPAPPTPVRAESATPSAPAADASTPAPEQAAAPVEDGPVHRPLIRATLPRPEGQIPVRPMPEFTIRQSGGRNGNTREDPRAAHTRGQRPQRPHQGPGNRPQGQRDGRPAHQMHGPGPRPKFGSRPGQRPNDRPQHQNRPARPQQSRPGPKRSK